MPAIHENLCMHSRLIPVYYNFSLPICLSVISDGAKEEFRNTSVKIDYLNHFRGNNESEYIQNIDNYSSLHRKT